MPTTRRLRTRSLRESIDPTRWAILADEPLSPDVNRFVLLDREHYNDLLPYWLEHRRAIPTIRLSQFYRMPIRSHLIRFQTH